MAIINCGLSYNQDISGCVDEVVFTIAELDPDTAYNVKWTYANGYKVNHEITTDESSSFTIINSGWWNTGTGTVLIEIKQGNDCNPIPFQVCGKDYTSMSINFTNSNDTNTLIPCTCPE